MSTLTQLIHSPKKETLYDQDENGSILLSMTVRDDTDFLSPYSVGDRPVIAGDVADFLDSRTDALPRGKKLLLRIHSDCITEEEMPLYERAVKEYYSERYAANTRELRRNTLLAVTFAVIGIAVLALLVILGTYLADSIWPEVIDIVAWVFLWEATDLYFLENRTLRSERKRLRTLLSMTVEFVKA